KIVFGLAFIAAGLLWILNLAGLLNFSFSLDGWWAFFVIIPCFFGLVSGPDRFGSLIGLCIGVLLLLSARGIVAWNDFWQFALAILVIGIGLKMIFFRGKCCSNVQELKTVSRDGKDIRSLEFNFGKQRLDYNGEKFEGLDVKMAFGGLEIDLRDAVIEEDVEIRIDLAFGGCEIRLPADMVVKTSVNCSFAGLSDERRNSVSSGTPVIFITGKAAFGGIELK
ncbi:MAG: LiaF transmembrane domain-containing protein, partial [Candidatus Cryptobacteroides sp.]